VHLAHAFEMLARGESVGKVAQALGYASPSAFTSMFRKLLGKTPQHYLAEWRGAADRGRSGATVHAA
jgi:AraC-like DNA-binding protein